MLSSAGKQTIVWCVCLHSWRIEKSVLNISQRTQNEERVFTAKRPNSPKLNRNRMCIYNGGTACCAREAMSLKHKPLAGRVDFALMFSEHQHLKAAAEEPFQPWGVTAMEGGVNPGLCGSQPHPPHPSRALGFVSDTSSWHHCGPDTHPSLLHHPGQTSAYLQTFRGLKILLYQKIPFCWLIF